MDQARLSRLVLAHRGKLERVQSLMHEPNDWKLVFCLRLAALLHRARDDADLPELGIACKEGGFVLLADGAWLATSPLTAAALDEEPRHWASVGMEFAVRVSRGRVADGARIDPALIHGVAADDVRR